MLWNSPCVAPASSGSVPPSRERMEKWTAQAILRTRGSTTSCTQALCQTRSSSSKLGLSLLNAQGGVAWLTFGRSFNLSIIQPEPTQETCWKNQPACSAAAPITPVWVWCVRGLMPPSAWAHCREPQLWSCVHKQRYSAPCLGQNAVWRCWREKWLVWMKIAESSC